MMLLNCSTETLESTLDSREIKPVNPKGNTPWIFIGRTDGWSWSANTLATCCKEPTLWKRPSCWERKIEGRRRRGWRSRTWFDGVTDSTNRNWPNSEDSEGQGNLVYCSPWDCRVRRDLVTEQCLKLLRNLEVNFCAVYTVKSFCRKLR